MKFVNKLSVISLVVLMFSFMNVANAADAAPPPAIAAACKGTRVAACNEIKGKSQCESSNHFEVYNGKGRQCAWYKSGVYCADSGGGCNPLLPTENNNTPPATVTNQVK